MVILKQEAAENVRKALKVLFKLLNIFIKKCY